MRDRLDPTYVRSQIDLLRTYHPEIWKDDEQLVLDALEGQTDFNDFLTAVVRRMLLDEAVVLGTQAQIADMKARHDRYERRIEALRALALKVMQHAEVRKIELPITTLSIRNGAQRVIITDFASLPEDCIRVKREPDKAAIKERITSGTTVPGAEMSNAEDYLHKTRG